MSEEDEVICEQCQTVPTQFVILDCEHKFCLYCISHAIHKDDSGVPCLKCNAPTVLDHESLQAVQQTKESQSQLSKTQPNYNVKPFTTEKRQYVQPIQEDPTIKGHPCLEKLNLAVERSLDKIRNIQFDKQQVKDKCQTQKSDIDTEFKALHMYLDSKQEEFQNQLSNIETSYLNELTKDEEVQQLDIEEMSIIKNEIKAILKSQDGQDIYTFKQLVATVDGIVQDKQLSIKQLNLFKQMQDELQQLSKKQAQFYQDFRRFFNILQPLQVSLVQNYASPIKLEYGGSITSDIQEKIRELKHRNSRSMNTSQLNNSRSQNSPPKNTFLNEEINISRKISREQANIVQQRKLGTSPMDAKTVLQSSMKHNNKSNSKFNKILNSPLTLAGFSYLS
ncbi:unnamed protein product (macronuclear) [Paramecium tetraurelia]|uniref:RING-type domain-containing protein n=1 Tax=Paramecium tetraurelia TaxID=5888 RepID=A0BL22_PARTE|nr:uncharacterized protein GSPATT00029870001 [Paramecium tetraurelia]CAK59239.1 unnamed protein product [Paramecium tetraurelia]|eukprot:XP_001426637.1 hypothetical protein (macronuclear) [Paramecium tetraurelia strain d4-2]